MESVKEFTKKEQQSKTLEESLNKALELGGKLIKEGRKKDGTYQYAIIQDPTGAVFGLGNAD